MATVNFYLNSGKGTPQNRPIMMSFHYTGQRLIYYTGIRIAENHFNKNSKTAPANPKNPDRVFINSRLTLLRNLIGQIFNENFGRLITPDEFRAAIDARYKVKPINDKITLLKYFQKYIDELPKKVNPQTGRPLSATMPAKYQTAKNVLQSFCQYQKYEIDFKDINEQFFNNFTNYLANEKNLSLNYISRIIKYLKTVLADAANNGVDIPGNFRKVLKAPAEDSEQVFLSILELEHIFNLDLSERPALEKVRDLFLIGCWTGLRYSDLTRVNSLNLQGNKIRITTQKTRKQVIVPLLGHVPAILKKYNNQLPPAISAQKFNRHLKTICELAEISEMITRTTTRGGKTIETTQPKFQMIGSHTARRSFATNAYLLGIDPLLIMAITGHTTESEFLKYIKISTLEKSELFEQQFSKAYKHENS